jgi:hypothetical protein
MRRDSVAEFAAQALGNLGGKHARPSLLGPDAISTPADGPVPRILPPDHARTSC